MPARLDRHKSVKMEQMKRDIKDEGERGLGGSFSDVKKSLTGELRDKLVRPRAETEEEKGGNGSGGSSGAERRKSDKTVIEQPSTIEERRRLISGENARPSSGAPVAAAVAATGHKVQFAAASSVLDQTDDVGSCGGGRGGKTSW